MKGNNGSAQITTGAKGTRIHFKITKIEDLERRLVKVSKAGAKNGYSSNICNIFQIQLYVFILRKMFLYTECNV